MQIMKREQSFFPPAAQFGHYALREQPREHEKSDSSNLK